MVQGGQHPLLASQGQSAAGFARVFVILQRAHEQLRSGCLVTLRDLYYQLKPTAALFKSAADVSTAVNAAAALLEVPRSALGIVCSSRGAFAGRLRVRQEDGWTDCSAPLLSGYPVPGNPADILAAVTETDARSGQLLGGCAACPHLIPGSQARRCLVVVEKEAVFSRLVSSQRPQPAWLPLAGAAAGCPWPG